MAKQFSDWQFIVLKGGVLWVDGVKKKSKEAARIVKAAIQAWNPEAEEPGEPVQAALWEEGDD